LIDYENIIAIAAYEGVSTWSTEYQNELTRFFSSFRIPSFELKVNQYESEAK
jgi:hypothetical protein